MNIIKLPKLKIKDSLYIGRHCKEGDYQTVIDKDTIIYDKETNAIVFILIKKAITIETARKVYPALMTAKKGKGLRNRGAYSGSERKKLYGENSKQSYSVPVHSYAGGYFERQGGRIPVCRKVSWTRNHPRAWLRAKVLLDEMSNNFKKHAPGKWDNQKQYMKNIHDDYCIDETVYTTVAVNLSVAGAYHRDSGDYKDGLGCMTVFMKGDCRNWDLCIPEYGVLVKIKDRDQILFDPHLLHGNTRGYGIGKKFKDWNRISVVAYVRKRLENCLSLDKELKRVREL
jgi:hypothetical protein